LQIARGRDESALYGSCDSGAAFRDSNRWSDTVPLSDLLNKLGERRTDSDRRLIDVLTAEPRAAAFFSTHELAKRSRVDPATVVRFSRKLGFDGYPALRDHLRNDLLGSTEAAAERMRSRIKQVERGSVLQTFIHGEIEHLSQLAERLTDAEIESAARAIMSARRTFLFATGHAISLVTLLTSRLGRIGYATQEIEHVSHDAAITLLQAQPGDAFVLFALNAVHPLIPKVLDHAASIGASSVLITDILDLTIRPKPTVVLAATRGKEGEPRSLTVPMAICNTIVLQISRLAKGKTLRKLETLDGLRKKIEILR
jgi:DNA-binding MurR/RpiR family transcriptional regulator